MPGQDEEVKETALETERVMVSPSDDDDEAESEGEDTAADSSRQEATAAEDEETEEGSEDEEKPEERDAPPADKGIKDVEGETPREKAMRLEVTRLKAKLRQERVEEIFEKKEPPRQEAKADPLSKYKPEEVANLKEAIEAMGYVSKAELATQTYAEIAQSQLDAFLDKHPEYDKANDKDNLLWSRFKEEYDQYKLPKNPRDLSKLFDKIHRELNPQSAGKVKEITAAKAKVKSASHGGAPSARATAKEKPVFGDLRLDMLKGFSDDEIAEITGE